MLIFVIWFLFIPESYLYCLDLYMNCGTIVVSGEESFQCHLWSLSPPSENISVASVLIFGTFSYVSLPVTMSPCHHAIM